MHRRLGIAFVLPAAFLFVQCAPAPEAGEEAGEPAAAPEAAPAMPSIEGTYRLVYRDLPDGTRQDPPLVEGLITFTSEYRNFNVLWHDENDSAVTLSVVSRYSLSDTEYSEELIYGVMTDASTTQIQGPGPSGTSPVMWEGGVLSYPMPLDEPDVRFFGDSLTATAEGVFVDHWVRVK